MLYGVVHVEIISNRSDLVEILISKASFVHVCGKALTQPIRGFARQLANKERVYGLEMKSYSGVDS